MASASLLSRIAGTAVLARAWIFGPLFALLLALSGCGGGGSGSNSSGSTPQACDASSCGTVMLSMTDADGDFLSYSVDVLSLTLRKANGAVVETLPASTRVDFAQLVDLTEFLTAATVPNGTYVEGSMRIDYSNADVTVEVNGQPRRAVIVGADGQPLGVVDVQIMLDNRNHVTVSPGRPAWLQLDFDLAASHTVDVSTDPAVATAEPFIVASLDPKDSREMRLRGPLVSVDVAASAYTIDIRPFLQPASRFGRITIHTTADTAFEVDGETLTGAPGLEALQRLGAGAPTVAFGTLVRADHTFTAERVHAGTSVPGATLDALWGNVTARDGDRLTVRGATLIRRTGSAVFIRGDVNLVVGPETKVIKDGQRGNDLGTDAISVGQRILAFGNAEEATTGVSFDAQQGRVRLHLTKLLGTVTSSNPGALALDLDSIDGRRIGIFDFAGTGASPANDADPANYEIETGALPLALMSNDSPVRVFGFVTPFGAAPPDFQARTLVDFSEIRAILGIGWGLRGTSAPFLTLGPEGITLDTANPDIGLRHHIVLGPRVIDLESLQTPPRIVPADDDRNVFAIGEPRRVEIFSDFGEFTARLATKLSGGEKAVGMSATGMFDAGTSTLSARYVTVSLKPAN